MFTPTRSQAATAFRATVCIIGLYACVPASGAVRTYTDQATWTQSASGLSQINFEGIVGADQYVYYATPPGLNVGNVNFDISNPAGHLFVVGDNYYYPQAVVSSQNTDPDTLQITFPSSTAFGLTYGQINITQTFTFMLSSGETFSYTNPPGLSFFGVTSDAPITAVSVSMPTSGYALNVASFAYGQSNVQTPVVSTNSLPNGEVNASYRQTLVAIGGIPPYAWTYAQGDGLALPSGLMGDPATGRISGVPTGPPGTYRFGVYVTDSAGTVSANQALAITITQLQLASDLTTTSVDGSCNPTAPPNSVFPPKSTVWFVYQVSGGQTGDSSTVQWTDPAGSVYTTYVPFNGPAPSPYAGVYCWDLNINAQQTPALAGNWSVALINNGALITSAPFSIQAPSQLSITPVTLPNGTVGVAYSQSLTATGGTAPYSNWQVHGAPPSGLSIDPSSGSISGKPLQAGTYPFSVTVQDSSGATSSPQSFSITINAAGMLVLPQGALTLNVTAGGPPVSASFPLGSSNGTALPFQVSVAEPAAREATNRSNPLDSASSPDNALSVSPASGVTPALITVTVDPTTLQPGVAYTYTVQFTSSGTLYTRPVIVQTAAAVAGFSVLPSILQFSLPQGHSGSTSLLLQEDGVTTSPYTVSVNNASATPWLTVANPNGVLTNHLQQTVIVGVNATDLSPGVYNATLTVTAGSLPPQQVAVAVTVIPSGAVLTLEFKGATFKVRQGQGLGIIQPVRVLDIGTAPLTWSATVDPIGAQYISIQASGMQSNPAAPGILSVSVNPAVANAPSVSPGLYYALITVSSNDAANGTQFFTAVVEVDDPTKVPAEPFPSPTGLVFTTPVDRIPSSQPIQVLVSSQAPAAFEAAPQFYSAPSGIDPQSLTWLQVSPHNGTTDTLQPGVVTVAVYPTGLAPGIYTGGVTIQIGTVTRVAGVTLVVEQSSLGTTESATGDRAQSAQQICEVTSLAPQFVGGLAGGFENQVAGPTAVTVEVVDNCGNPVPIPGSGDPAANVVIKFDSGDPRASLLTLTDPAHSGYSVMWNPDASQDQVAVSVQASTSSIEGSATAIINGSTQVVGSVDPSTAPTLSPNAVLNVFGPVEGGSVAPGALVQIYGTNLAASGTGSQTQTLPLPLIYAGTQILVNGEAAPLLYISQGQINAQLPVDLNPGQTYDVLALVNGAPTVPVSVSVAPAVPGLFTSSTPAGLLGGEDYTRGTSLGTGANIGAGDILVLYLVGLGSTTPVVPSGTAGLANTVDSPQVLIDGQIAGTVLFAGLTSSYVGLYQLNYMLPAGLASGPHTIEIAIDGASSNIADFTVGP